MNEFRPSYHLIDEPEELLANKIMQHAVGMPVGIQTGGEVAAREIHTIVKRKSFDVPMLTVRFWGCEGQERLPRLKADTTVFKIWVHGF